MTEPGVWIALVALGAVVTLDVTSVGQFMISRPLVSGILAGAALGDAQAGLVVGGVLEAAHLGGLPVGGARLPDPGPAAVPGVAAAVAIGGAAGLAAGALLGAVWSLLGGATVPLQRRWNGAITRPIDEGRSSARGLALRHWACIALDGMRGAVLTAAGLLVAALLEREVDAAWWRLGGAETVALLLLPGALTSGALLRAWAFPRRRALLFLLGAAGGIVIATALR
jgi:mannose/fructose/N-acetylgalactosamine-specific phosphotransferase system component IIC